MIISLEKGTEPRIMSFLHKTTPNFDVSKQAVNFFLLVKFNANPFYECSINTEHAADSTQEIWIIALMVSTFHFMFSLAEKCLSYQMRSVINKLLFRLQPLFPVTACKTVNFGQAVPVTQRKTCFHIFWP